GVEIPVEVRLLERRQRCLQNFQAARFAEPAPVARGEKALMARIAKFLDLMKPFFGFGLVVLNAAVKEQKVTSGRQHPRRLANETLWRTEMMRGHSTGHKVKTAVLVRESLGRMLARQHI